MFFAIRVSGNATGLIPSLREAMRSVDSRLVVDEFTTMERLVSASVAQPRLNALLLAVFSVVAVFLAAVGLYGVVSHSVSKRTREMGIRLALGADHAALLRLVARVRRHRRWDSRSGRLHSARIISPLRHFIDRSHRLHDRDCRCRRSGDLRSLHVRAQGHASRPGAVTPLPVNDSAV